MKTSPGKTSRRTKQSIRIVLADDHLFIRGAIRALLEKSKSMKVVAEAADCREMLRLVEKRKPDVVVMNTELPADNGLHATTRLHQQPGPRIPVVLIGARNGEQALRALKASASGYVLMNSSPKELGMAIKRVIRGQTYLSPSIGSQNTPIRLVRCESRVPSPVVLSQRQRETLRLIAEGNNTKEIASILGVSPKTVEYHRVQLMKRLKTRTLSGLIRQAFRMDLAGASVRR